MTGKKQTSSQRKKTKKNQAKQKDAVKEAHPKEDKCENNAAVKDLADGGTLKIGRPTLLVDDVPAPTPLKEFLFRDPTGKIFSSRSYAIKMLLNNQRPVQKNAKGDFMFEYPGFAPFKTYLSCVYILMDAAMETSFIYDGNGHTIPNMLSPACMMCKNCDSVHRRSKHTQDRIVEMELCDGHVHEQLTMYGFKLPTKRDRSSVDEYQTKTHLPNRGPVGLSQENNKELHNVQNQYLVEGMPDLTNLKVGEVEADEPPREKTIYDDVE